ncbi:MAG TPA: hypothetical protein H9706_04025 [Candidatus Gemmiger stercorigallinarum]|nr:hypothetical protein [Candidatus Gemmiger stercorigallinarum]
MYTILQTDEAAFARLHVLQARFLVFMYYFPPRRPAPAALRRPAAAIL